MVKNHADWLIGALSNHREVAHAEPIGPSLVRVARNNGQLDIVGVVSASRVQTGDCEPILNTDIRPHFILNKPILGIWDGNAIDYLESEGVAWGKMYDIFRGLNIEDNLSNYRNPGLSFIERIFRQHRNVVKIERISDQVYRLHRRKGDPVTVALTDAYDVTADTVRTSHDAFAPFDVLLKNTPYGRISSNGQGVAATLGVEICDQSSIFSRLAK